MSKDVKTDEQIKQCLKACSKSDCDSCIYESPERGDKSCTDILLQDALSLINRYERRIVEMTDEHSKQLLQILEKFSK